MLLTLFLPTLFSIRFSSFLQTRLTLKTLFFLVKQDRFTPFLKQVLLLSLSAVCKCKIQVSIIFCNMIKLEINVRYFLKSLLADKACFMFSLLVIDLWWFLIKDYHISKIVLVFGTVGQVKTPPIKFLHSPIYWQLLVGLFSC